MLLAMAALVYPLLGPRVPEPLALAPLAPAPALAAAPDAQGTLGEALGNAEAALERGAARAAQRQLEALTRAPAFGGATPLEETQAWLLLGAAASRAQDPEAAEEAYARVLARPLDPEAQRRAGYGLAEALLGMKDAEPVPRALAKVGEASPRRALLEGLAAYLQGDTHTAERSLGRAAESLGGPEAPLYLGIIAFDRGDHAAARPLFEAALARDRNDPLTRMYLARVLFELGRTRETLDALEPLLRDPPPFEASLLAGQAALRLEGGEGARKAEGYLARARELEPGDAEASFALSRALRRLGKEAEADACLARFREARVREAERDRKVDRALQRAAREPRDVVARREAARACLEARDLESAERHAWRAVRLAPRDLEARLVLARALREAGRWTASSVQYQRLLELDPGSTEARRELEELVRLHAARKGG